MIKPLLSATLLLAVAGCVTPTHQVDPAAMQQAASALTKLSAAVEAHVRYAAPQEGLHDQALLTEATQADPALLAPFSGYLVKIRRQDRHAIVLVCSKDGQHALLEDAGCTGRLEAQRWQVPAPCGFTLSSEAACKSR